MQFKIRAIVRWFLFLMLLSSLSQQAFARDPLRVSLPVVPVPDGASWSWVGKKMAYNGMPTSIKIFEYRGNSEDVKSFYKDYWRSKGNGQTQEKDFGLNTILSHDLRGVYTTVQYRMESGLVKGKVVVTESPGRVTLTTKSEIPVPPGAEVASRVESMDGGRRTESVTLESHKSVNFNRGYYESQMDFDGWSLVYETETFDSSVQHYQKGSDLLQVTVKEMNGIDVNRSLILVHWTK